MVADPALSLPTPKGGDLPVEAVDQDVIPVEPVSHDGDDFDIKRGEKRSSDLHLAVENMAQQRSLAGPSHVPAPETLSSSSDPPLMTVGQSQSRRARSRTPPPRESSLWAYRDFEGNPSDHVSEGWGFMESREHEYSGKSIALQFDKDLEEIVDGTPNVHIVKEMCLNAAMLRNRQAEVNERYLQPDEREMFRAAKKTEWSQWRSNDVVELISRHGIDPHRIISSRWVLTWKRVEETPNSPVKAKARLVIRGFRDPDLGQFSTASPTDRSARVKPIYAELPKDLVRESGYSEDTIALIKKVPYGLSEAPLAWYRRLTSELEACGFEQVKADRCLYVLRHPKEPGRILGIIRAHVDDLLIAGCSSSSNPLFESSLKKLTTRLPCGHRKYADLTSVLYTGINVRQHPQSRAIQIDQMHYIQTRDLLVSIGGFAVGRGKHAS